MSEPMDERPVTEDTDLPDLAHHELDLAAGLVEHAQHMAPSESQRKTQNQAKLHLLTSMAISLYEIRTRVLEAFEILAHPPVTFDEQCKTIDRATGERCVWNKHQGKEHEYVGDDNLPRRFFTPVSGETNSAHRSEPDPEE